MITLPTTKILIDTNLLVSINKTIVKTDRYEFQAGKAIFNPNLLN